MHSDTHTTLIRIHTTLEYLTLKTDCIPSSNQLECVFTIQHFVSVLLYTLTPFLLNSSFLPSNRYGDYSRLEKSYVYIRNMDKEEYCVYAQYRQKKTMCMNVIRTKRDNVDLCN